MGICQSLTLGDLTSNACVLMVRISVYHVNSVQHGVSTVPLDVNLGLAPTWFELDSHGVLTATMWLKLTWRDYRLSWLPDRHENISMIRYKILL